MGTSTLALNLALAYFQRTRKEIIAAEIRAGQGTWAGELNFPNAEGLNNLLNMRSGEVTRAAVEKELVRTTFGIRLLLANHRIKDFALLQSAVPQLEAILHHLDIGRCGIRGYRQSLLTWL